MGVLRIAHPPGREAERRYVLDVVLRERLGLDWVAEPSPREDVEIVLADGGPGSVRMADALLSIPAAAWLRESSLPRSPLPRVEPGLPVLFGEPLPGGGFVQRGPDGVSYGVDVLGGCFFMLTRYEEIAVGARDAHDRFPSTASVAHRERFLDVPIVDEYVELLWSGLVSTWPRLRRRQRAPVVRPTHDVDWPRAPRQAGAALARTLAGDLVRRRDPVLALDRAIAQLRRRARRGDGRDLHDTFDFLMDVSEANGLTSAFYFMAGSTRPGLDGDYSLDDPWIAQLLRRIHEREHEIGLHPSYETFRRPELVKREFDTLVQACTRLGIDQGEWGGRQHYLRWENPTTWQAWEDAGLAYDSSLGFADRVGFRTGACFEYPAFNLRTGRRLRLRERPLIAMETSLFDYAGLSRAEAREVVLELRERCRRRSGEFTLLWHNSSLLSRRDRRLYARVLGD